MKTGIVGFPQVGKSALFTILTKLSASAHKNPRDANIGVAKIPDYRLDRLAALYHPEKLTHASVDYVDMGAIGDDSFNDAGYVASLRGVDSLAHVIRAFEEPVHPLEDIKKVNFEMLVSDLAQVEKRLSRLEQDLKKMRNVELEREFEVLKKAKAHLEKELPLREMEMNVEDKKQIRGFMFLSEKPILYVVNVAESETADLEHIAEKYQLGVAASRPNADVTAICGKIEAELAEMDESEAAEFLAGYGLQESGLVRLVRKTYELLGMISFFTAGEDECRAWTVPRGSKAVEAAGVIHTDLSKHFIRAETIRWDQLLEAGSEAAARAKGTLRLEGKDYIVQDGDVLHIRHSG